MKKIIVTCILLLAITLSGFSQSNKLKEKADNWVNNLNTEIISVDKSLALTEVQKKQIVAIQVERLKELKKAKKKVQIRKQTKLLTKNISKTYLRKY